MAESPANSPFHKGEQEIQRRLGVRDQIEAVGQRFIHDHLPDQHREFYEHLPMVLIGSVDDTGQPWASLLTGPPGFMRSPDGQSLHISAAAPAGDPMESNVSVGSSVGLLGIEYQTRRRNRLTGRIAAFSDEGLEIRIDQAFGNCPQYIQMRDFLPVPARDRSSHCVYRTDVLDERASALVRNADNFYIASYYADDSGGVTNGADVSHRGGKPGFVRVEDSKTLIYPEFSGNNHFNTLGNLQLNPRAGLLFVDFDKGDLLYLACDTEIVWDSEEGRAFTGAERLVRLTIKSVILIEGGMPIRWQLEDYSPSLEKTGSWEDVEEKIAARREGNVYREYVVDQVQIESENVTSFYLTPQPGQTIPCHRAGQFLPIEIQPAGADQPIRRTYTISNAPNGAYYRLSIKREPSPGDGLLPGLASNAFHDDIQAGATIRALSPRGTFTLDTESERPVVLLSAGVGITPMLSMLEQLAQDAAGCGCKREVWFIHGVRNGNEHAFSGTLESIARRWPRLTTHIRYSRPGEDDRLGTDFDSEGRIDGELLSSLLPLGDYDFYLCGPTPFLENLYEALNDLGVNDSRIHYELFHPGTTVLRKTPGASEGLPEDMADRDPVQVRFEKTGIEIEWNPSSGTLLDLAESQGLRPAYSCRSGICQTCSTRITSGAVDYVAPPMADPPQGEALICCAYPAPSAGEDTLILEL
jgi:ferredoxin-NADP reductase/predicted pyridoxine 5'-phosphate oxidase superfamily flavin-nucleotide-binding protein